MAVFVKDCERSLDVMAPYKLFSTHRQELIHGSNQQTGENFTKQGWQEEIRWQKTAQ